MRESVIVVPIFVIDSSPSRSLISD